MTNYPFANTECDWCEQKKDCRGLEDRPGNVVLTICEDCDKTTEFESTEDQPKENTMKCIAITKKNRACKRNDHKLFTVLVSGEKAVLESKVNSNNMSGWLQYELPFCEVHGKTLGRKPINIQYVKNTLLYPRSVDELMGHTTTKEEKEMKDMTIEQLEELLLQNVEWGAEVNNQPGSYETKEEQQAELDEAAAEYDEIEALIKEKQAAVDGTLCGHCHEYHKDPAAVAACYGFEPVPGAIRQNRVKKAAMPGRVKEWHKTRRYLDDHHSALVEAGFLGLKRFPATKGHGYWMYWTAYPEQLPRSTRPVTNRVKQESHGVRCGNCSTFEDAVYHPSTAEVKACYAGGK